MSVLYEVRVNLDEVVSEVRRGLHPGLSIYKAEDPSFMWPIAITDGTNYIWPEGAYQALTWGRSDGGAILDRLKVPYTIL